MTEVGPESPQESAERPDSAAAPHRFGEHARQARSDLEQHARQARAEFEQHVAQARAEFDLANERIRQRTGRDLILAILIGVGIGALLIAALIFWKILFVPFAMAALILGTFEISRALQVSGRRVDVVPQVVVCAALMSGAYVFSAWGLWIAVVVGVVGLVVWRLFAQMVAADGRTYGDVFHDVLVAAFLPLYLGFLASLAVVLLRQDHGEWWVLAFIIVVVASDTGAYAAGLAWGKHPMAPKISPAKTWEGFAGAVVAAVIAGVLLAVFMLGLPWWAGIVFGLVLLASATIGDLGESMLKRDLGIKDMSSWLPGHGGVLDRLDSILPSAAAALCLYYVFAIVG